MNTCRVPVVLADHEVDPAPQERLCTHSQRKLHPLLAAKEEKEKDISEENPQLTHSEWEQWCTPIISALRRPRQEGCEFKVNWNYTVRLCLKTPRRPND